MENLLMTLACIALLAFTVFFTLWVARESVDIYLDIRERLRDRDRY